MDTKTQSRLSSGRALRTEDSAQIKDKSNNKVTAETQHFFAFLKWTFLSSLYKEWLMFGFQYTK